MRRPPEFGGGVGDTDPRTVGCHAPEKLTPDPFSSWWEKRELTLSLAGETFRGRGGFNGGC